MQPVKIGVLISGGGTNLQAVIDNIENNTINGEIAIVISNRKSAYGLVRAKEHGIENMFISKKQFPDNESFDCAIISELEARNVEVILLAGYLNILTPVIVRKYRNRIINIHPSLIPSFCGKGYYGEYVHKAVLEYGAKISGVTVHFVDEGTDTGPIILQKSVPVKDDDTVEILQKRVLQVEHEILPRAVKFYCDRKLQVVEEENKRPFVKITK